MPKDKPKDNISKDMPPIDVHDTALIKSLVDSAYASDTIDWPTDFEVLDTTDLVNFASIKAHLSSLAPCFLTDVFGECIENGGFCFGDFNRYESEDKLNKRWTKEMEIMSQLLEVNYCLDYDRVVPILSRLDDKFDIEYKTWLFDDSHFLEVYYLSSDTSLVPIDGYIIHIKHPILEME